MSTGVYMLAYEGTTPDPGTTSQVYFAKVTEIAKTEPVPTPADCAAIVAELERTQTKLGTTRRLATIKTKVAANAADVADD